MWIMDSVSSSRQRVQSTEKNDDDWVRTKVRKRLRGCLSSCLRKSSAVGVCRVATCSEAEITGVIPALNVTRHGTSAHLHIHKCELLVMNTESTIMKFTRACAITTFTRPQSLEQRGRAADEP